MFRATRSSVCSVTRPHAPAGAAGAAACLTGTTRTLCSPPAHHSSSRAAGRQGRELSQARTGEAATAPCSSPRACACSPCMNLPPLLLLSQFKEFQIYRWNPDSPEKPKYVSYKVDINRCAAATAAAGGPAWSSMEGMGQHVFKGVRSPAAALPHTDSRGRVARWQLQGCRQWPQHTAQLWSSLTAARNAWQCHGIGTSASAHHKGGRLPPQIQRQQAAQPAQNTVCQHSQGVVLFRGKLFCFDTILGSKFFLFWGHRGSGGVGVRRNTRNVREDVFWGCSCVLGV